MFCPNCGNKLIDGARFCDACGTKIEFAPNTQPIEPPVENDEQAAPVETPTASPIGSEPEQTPAPEIKQEPEPTPTPEPVPTPEPAPEPTQEPAPASAPAETVDETPNRQNFSAAATIGETALGSIKSTAFGAATAAIPGPMKVIGGSVKQFFSSIKSSLKDPKRLIPAIVLAVLWLAIGIIQAAGWNPVPVKIISFLTFAQAGMNGGFFGAVGGIIGKTVFAGAGASLVNSLTNKNKGKKRSFGETAKGALGVSLDTLWAYLTGIGAAMLLYLFISGGATRISFMGGIAAAFLSARAALNNGFLRRLLGSFTKRKSPSDPNVQGLIRGLSVGFGAAALIGLANINLILIITGSVLLVGGVVMMILQATGVVKLGKEAAKQ